MDLSFAYVYTCPAEIGYGSLTPTQYKASRENWRWTCLSHTYIRVQRTSPMALRTPTCSTWSRFALWSRALVTCPARSPGYASTPATRHPLATYQALPRVLQRSRLQPESPLPRARVQPGNAPLPSHASVLATCPAWSRVAPWSRALQPGHSSSLATCPAWSREPSSPQALKP
jgi:hypothetical protein